MDDERKERGENSEVWGKQGPVGRRVVVQWLEGEKSEEALGGGNEEKGTRGGKEGEKSEEAVGGGREEKQTRGGKEREGSEEVLGGRKNASERLAEN